MQRGFIPTEVEVSRVAKGLRFAYNLKVWMNIF